MVRRFQNQVHRNMPLEKRARKLFTMKALARNNFKVQNKENENPLNNNLVLAMNFTHSTPLKNQHQITDIDMVEESEKTKIDQEKPEKEKEKNRTEEPELVITKIYDLEPNLTEIVFEENENDTKVKDFEVEVTPSKMIKGNQLNVISNEHKKWKSQEFLNESAEYEFCKSLEQSKMYLSTFNLLEEIEADLPPPYSLTRPLNHTFHTLSSYRTLIRLNRMDANATYPENSNFELSCKNQTLSKKLSNLEMEATVQKSMIEQTEKALTFSRSQKLVETEDLEKTLFLADLRFNATRQEIERLKIVGDFSEDDFGQITISDAAFKVDKTKGNENDFFVCTATYKENVQFSYMRNETNSSTFHFQEPIKFQNLNKYFIIFIEIYKKVLKENKAPLKTSILKKLKELAAINGSKNFKNIHTSNHGFTCVARGELRLHQIRQSKNNICTLNFLEPPQYPIMGSGINLVVKTDVNLIEFKQSGFLNIFKQTWQRRWYIQSGHFLESWLYPEDQENDKPPVDSIFLGNSSATVEIADIEFCVRPHSFFIKLGSIEEKILFSADSQKEMIKWMDHLNSIFNQIRIWNQNN